MLTLITKELKIKLLVFSEYLNKIPNLQKHI